MCVDQHASRGQVNFKSSRRAVGRRVYNLIAIGCAYAWAHFTTAAAVGGMLMLVVSRRPSYMHTCMPGNRPYFVKVRAACFLWRSYCFVRSRKPSPILSRVQKACSSSYNSLGNPADHPRPRQKVDSIPSTTEQQYANNSSSA